MNSENDDERSLRDLELAVEAEGRAWMRQRLEQKLQAQADRLGSVFPPRFCCFFRFWPWSVFCRLPCRPRRPLVWSLGWRLFGFLFFRFWFRR